MKMGKVTSALHACDAGQHISIRGPYGNHFSVEEWNGKNILTIGGGIGQAPLRPIIQYIIDNRDDFGRLDIIYGARTSSDLCFKVAPAPANTIAITCGPPIMIKFVMQALLEMGFTEDQIFTTLENRMKCGIGKCGRCNVGELYVMCVKTARSSPIRS